VICLANKLVIHAVRHFALYLEMYLMVRFVMHVQ
jgi:hypothetical protein